MTFAHATVLRAETVDAIEPRPGGQYADVTLGGGGHAEAILERSTPSGRLLGIDRDPLALAASRDRLAPFGERAHVLHGRMAELPRLAAESGLGPFDGIVADLGVSSPQIDAPLRGFSFSGSGPLDMRMDPTGGTDARALVHALREDELADILYHYGEERRSRRIARSIKRAAEDGRMETTEDLRTAVHRAVGPRAGRIDSATLTFQALRIAVNGELDELDALLAALPEQLAPGGVAAIISFHSLEDRRVKYAFRDDPRLEPLWKKPVTASDEECAANPRARSAKLRAARRVSAEASP